MNLMKAISSRFRKPKLPNLKDSVEKANTLAEELDNFAFYLQQLENHKISAIQADYLNKAIYNLVSFRDELQISLNERKDKKLMEVLLGKFRN